VNDLPALRRRILTQRAALSTETRAEAALHFCHRLFQSKHLDTAQRIGAYLAHRGELDLHPCIEKLWQQGKQVYLPSLNQDVPQPQLDMIFKLYEPETPLQPNRFGILESTHSLTIDPQDLDVVLVPLVAFDAAGHRIGMGKGYYDRTFAFRNNIQSSRPLLIGCAYAFQATPLFTPATHDVAMDVILTTL
jgi:5-formyltetrahydrofolate cyclo-ligase